MSNVLSSLFNNIEREAAVDLRLALNTIREASDSLFTLIITYTDLKGNTTDREIEPYEVRRTANNIYLWGYDIYKGEIRQFRLEGIQAISITYRKFEPRWDIKI